jgi:hypothetical protein
VTTVTTRTAECSIVPSAILAILQDIATTLLPHAGLNERYVHHAFSHRLQTMTACLDLAAPHSTLLLHPEWPTYKNATSIAFAKCRNTTFPDGKNAYMPVNSDDLGSAGFIDFAIGPYDAPAIGVEFSLKMGWGDEEVVYDFLKLLDPRNPFTAAFSHNLIIRERHLATGYRRDNLESHMNNALHEAVHRLDNLGIAINRDTQLIVSEVATHERRHWHYDPTKQAFMEGLA